MNQAYLQKSFQEDLFRSTQFMRKVLRHPVVLNDDDASKVGRGLTLIKGFTPEERKALSKETPESLAKAKDDVRIAAAFIMKNMKLLNDALLGSLSNNDVGVDMMNGLAKNFHIDGTRAANAGVVLVSNSLDLGSTVGIDLGWVPAFTAVDARNAEKVRVVDFETAMQFFEVNDETDIPDAVGLISNKSQEYGPRFFSSAFTWNERKMRFSMVTVNQVLAMMRAAALTTITKHAYREIFTYQSSFTKYDNGGKFAGTVSDWTASNKQISGRIRYTLNETHRKMTDRANGVVGLEERGDQDEARLTVTVNDPFYFFYNHRWYREVELAQRMTGGDDGVNEPMLKNWIFVPTHLAPMSGAYTVSSETADPERDRTGFKGKLTEAGPAGRIGGAAMIPGRRNNYATFRDFILLSERSEVGESQKVVGKLAQNFVKDDRQYAWVDFGKVTTPSS